MKPLNIFVSKLTQTRQWFTTGDSKTKPGRNRTRPSKCEQKTTSNLRVERHIKINRALCASKTSLHVIQEKIGEVE